MGNIDTITRLYDPHDGFRSGYYRCSSKCQDSVCLFRFSNSVSVLFNTVGVVIVVVKNMLNMDGPKPG